MAKFDARKLRDLIAYVVAFSSLFVLLVIFSRTFRLADILNIFNSSFWLYAIFLQTLSIFIAGLGWASLAAEETSISRREKIKIAASHSISWAARYVPGYVTQLTGKVMGLRDFGISVIKASQMIFIEFIYMGLSAASLGLLLFATWGFLSESSFWLKILTLALASVLTLLYFSSDLKPAVVKLLALAPFLKNRLVDENHMGKRVPIFYFVSRVFNVASYIFVALTISDQSTGVILLAGTAIIAGLAGQLVPFVPSGIGVREWTGVGLLSMLAFSLDPAITFMLMSRFVMLMSDLIALAAGVVFYAVTSKKPR